MPDILSFLDGSKDNGDILSFLDTGPKLKTTFVSDPAPGSARPPEGARAIHTGEVQLSASEQIDQFFGDFRPRSSEEAPPGPEGQIKQFLDNLGINIVRAGPEFIAQILDNPIQAVAMLPELVESGFIDQPLAAIFGKELLIGTPNFPGIALIDIPEEEKIQAREDFFKEGASRQIFAAALVRGVISRPAPKTSPQTRIMASDIQPVQVGPRIRTEPFEMEGVTELGALSPGKSIRAFPRKATEPLKFTVEGKILSSAAELGLKRGTKAVAEAERLKTAKETGLTKVELRQRQEAKELRVEDRLQRKSTVDSFGHTGFPKGEFDRIIETAETGKPFQANLFRVETKGRRDFAGVGVFVGTERFADVLQPVLGGKKTTVIVNLDNPIIINSKPLYLKKLADAGDKVARAMIDESTGFLKDDIPLNRIDSFVAKRARDAGHDGIININEMEIQVIKSSGVKSVINDRLAQIAREAQARLDARAKKTGIELRSGIRPEDFADFSDVTIILATRLAQGTVKFAEWSTQMIKEFGDLIKPQLQNIWNQANEVASGKTETALIRLKNMHDAITMNRAAFDQSVSKLVNERMKVVSKDRSLSQVEKNQKRKELQNLFTSKAARKAGVSIRVTQAGTVAPSIRKAGVFVPTEFVKYPNYKDVRGILSRDPTTAIQAIDGALSVEAKSKLPGQAGPAERYVLWRTRDVIKMRSAWNNEVSVRLKEIVEGLTKEQEIAAGEVLRVISDKDVSISPEVLARRKNISEITADLAVIKYAQGARVFYERVLESQNSMRTKRNQRPINRREFYSPDIFKEAVLWDRVQFWNKDPRAIFEKPTPPDFIKPDKPFNPRELAKKGGMEKFEIETNLTTLLENYANTASRDIFNTSIIQNNKVFAQQLRNMKLDNSARFIEDWTAEAFAGIRGSIDRGFHLSNSVAGVMGTFRKGLILSVFPLNVAWTVSVQTASSALTVARYGTRNSLLGAFDWFTNKQARKSVTDNAYSAIIKADRASRVTQQDIGIGSTGRIKIRKTKLENTVDAFNFMTEWTERQLTGWSVLVAKRHGETAGLKGKALWEYASDGGAKTQSMYNLEDAPGYLRNQIVKTAAPFQTFRFTMWNTMKEFAGRAGTPPATFKKRAGMVLRFAGSIAALNYIGSKTTGREPWDLRAMIPFYDALLAPAERALTKEIKFGGRGEPAPVGMVVDLLSGIERLITKGDWSKLRSWLIRFVPGWFGIPAGTQVNRIVDGIIVAAQDGDFEASGRMKFPVTEVDDKLIAIVMGKYATPGGQAYLDRRANKRKQLVDQWLLKPNPIKLLLDPDTVDGPPIRQRRKTKDPRGER